MRKRLFSMFAIVGLAMATTLSLSLLTACDDDDDDDSIAETSGNSTEAGEAVDLGLTVKWADVNVGAAKPADYGGYYAWGEPTTKDSYKSDNSTTYNDSTIVDFSGNSTYDAATANWGSSWRIPTKTECQELIDNCTWTWTTQEDSDGNTISGYEVKGSNGNSIFLPAAGCCNGSSLEDAGTLGSYWSSTPNDDNTYSAENLSFNSSYPYVNSQYYRYYGRSVRPVAD